MRALEAPVDLGLIHSERAIVTQGSDQMNDSSVTRWAALTLVACCLATTAKAGDIRIIVSGSVVAVTGRALPAPLDAAAVGDAFEGVFEAIDDHLVSANGTWRYPIDLLQGHVRIGASQTILETIGGGTVSLQDGPIDVITMGTPVRAGFLTAINLGYFDIAGQIFSSPDLSALIGTTIPIGAIGSSGSIATSQSPAMVMLTLTEIRIEAGTCARLGDNYCLAENNSINREGVMGACGSLSASANDVLLTAFDLPENAFGFFLASQSTGFVANPGGSEGNLCLSGAVGRFVGPGQITSSGTLGRIQLQLDLTQIPSPSGLVSIQPGETWHFTAWHRDTAGGVSTSNFANGLSLTFL